MIPNLKISFISRASIHYFSNYSICVGKTKFSIIPSRQICFIPYDDKITIQLLDRTVLDLYNFICNLIFNIIITSALNLARTRTMPPKSLLTYMFSIVINFSRTPWFSISWRMINTWMIPLVVENKREHTFNANWSPSYRVAVIWKNGSNFSSNWHII